MMLLSGVEPSGNKSAPMSIVAAMSMEQPATINRMYPHFFITSRSSLGIFWVGSVFLLFNERVTKSISRSMNT